MWRRQYFQSACEVIVKRLKSSPHFQLNTINEKLSNKFSVPYIIFLSSSHYRPCLYLCVCLHMCTLCVPGHRVSIWLTRVFRPVEWPLATRAHRWRIFILSRATNGQLADRQPATTTTKISVKLPCAYLNRIRPSTGARSKHISTIEHSYAAERSIG